MADINNPADNNLSAFLPTEIIAYIESLLTLPELAGFKQTCKLLNNIASDVQFLQPMYNRLYAIDPSLPALLTPATAVIDFNAALLKIRKTQNAEVESLKQRYSDLFTMEGQEVLSCYAPETIEALERKEAWLDIFNANMIERVIEKNPLSITLSLSGMGITRIPIAMIKIEANPYYWERLQNLDCSNNKIMALNNLSDLKALQILDCQDNNLTALNLCNFPNLTTLNCDKNNIVFLRMHKLPSFINLSCNKNKISDLNLTTLSTLQFLQCKENNITSLNLENLSMLNSADLGDTCSFLHLNLSNASNEVKERWGPLEKRLLFNQLATATPAEAELLIKRLGHRYDYLNCLEHLGADYAKTSFQVDRKKSDDDFDFLEEFKDLSISTPYVPSFTGQTNIEVLVNLNILHSENQNDDDDLYFRI